MIPVFLFLCYFELAYGKTHRSCTKKSLVSRQDRQLSTVKPVLSGHSKKDKTKVLKANGSLMKVGSIAECSKRAFCNTFDLH